MGKFFQLLCLFALLGLQACSSSSPPPSPAVPGANIRRMVVERVSAVVVTDRKNLNNWVGKNFSASLAPRDADGGSATPISSDGYFLTADHVLAQSKGRNVFIIGAQGGSFRPMKARIVWRSKPSDIAVLHIAKKTPFFFEWTTSDQWLPIDTMVIHGGIATSFRSAPGRLMTPLPPEGTLTGTRPFKIDIPLQPGDSGGPIVDAYGKLLGINSAVEFLVPMETAFFIDSEGKRPNLSALQSILETDRARNRSRR